MKKIALILLFATTTSFAQLGIGISFKNSYKDAIVNFQNGSTQVGEISGFLGYDGLIFGSSHTGFERVEKKLLLTDRKFNFKRGGGGPETILSEDVTSVTLPGEKIGEERTYYFLKLKTVNSKGEIVDLGIKAWLPLILETQKINIYGYNLIMHGSPNATKTMLYLKRKEDDFVLIPVDFNRIGFGKNLAIKASKSFQEIFRDCPEMVSVIQSDFKGKYERGNFYKEIFKKRKKHLKSERKKIGQLPRKDRFDAQMDICEEEMLKPYQKYLKMYYEKCPE